jgi:hypothetical protein
MAPGPPSISTGTAASAACPLPKVPPTAAPCLPASGQDIARLSAVAKSTLQHMGLALNAPVLRLVCAPQASCMQAQRMNVFNKSAYTCSPDPLHHRARMHHHTALHEGLQP